MRKLGGNTDLIADSVFFQNLTECFLASLVDICRIIIIDTQPIGFHEFLLGFIEIYGCPALCKAHAAVSKYRPVVPVFIFSILHVYHSS